MKMLFFVGVVLGLVFVGCVYFLIFFVFVFMNFVLVLMIVNEVCVLVMILVLIDGFWFDYLNCGVMLNLLWLVVGGV